MSDTSNNVRIYLKDGKVDIQMFPDKAPNHVAHIKKLAKGGFYDGLKFHRVIDGFMAQTGCPFGEGTGGININLNAEFNDTPHDRGTCSMARAANPNSASTQFFICFAKSAFLDGQYTAWGKVIAGMDAVDKIKKGNKAANGSVDSPDKILRMVMVDDDV